MTTSFTRAIVPAALLLLSGAHEAVAQDNQSRTWVMSIDGASAPGTFFAMGELVMAGTTLPQNNCTAGPTEIGAGHGTWQFRAKDGRMRWATVNKLTGQEAWVIAASGVAQRVQSGPPVFNGVARIERYLDADALQQGTPSCTTQVLVNGFMFGGEGDHF